MPCGVANERAVSELELLKGAVGEAGGELTSAEVEDGSTRCHLFIGGVRRPHSVFKAGVI